MVNNSRNNPERTFDVEFLGGPFDGMQASVPELEDGLIMPVSENAMRKASGGEEGQPSTPVSVAIYHLVQRRGRWCYQYTGATSPREARLEEWLV